MKSILAVIIFMAAASLTFAADFQSQEKSLSELEVKSIMLAIDANNHINSIQAKNEAASKASMAISNSDVFLEAGKVIQNKTYELLSKADDYKMKSFALQKEMLDSNWVSLFGSVNGKASPATRLEILRREITCTEFSLSLLTFNSGELFNESIQLGNTVLKTCKKINDSQPGTGRTPDAPEKKQDLIRKK